MHSCLCRDSGEMTFLGEYLLSDDTDIIRFIAWHLVYFVILMGSWIPIWRQSEKRQPRYPGNSTEKNKSGPQDVIIYGYQTRKRREWNDELYARWVLMNPDYFYNGILWSLVCLSAAAGCYYAQKDGDHGDVRTVGLSLASWQAGVFGMWTIAPFYWDMPGWGVLHLVLTTLMSITTSVLFAYLDWYAFGFYTVFTVAQVILTSVYATSFLLAISDGRPYSSSNPLTELIRGNGMHPVSFLEKDGYLSQDPLQDDTRNSSTSKKNAESFIGRRSSTTTRRTPKNKGFV